ncbi:MAG: peptide chain release factor 2 [Patescibacteria group bacterium]
MSHLTDHLNQLSTRLDQAWSILNISEKLARIEEIKATMAEPGFWDNHSQAEPQTKELAQLESITSVWKTLRSNLKSTTDLAHLADTESDQSLKDATTIDATALEEQFASLEFALLMRGEFDERATTISIHAGAGGTEATDWVAMLLRMYLRFAEKKGWATEILDQTTGEETGYKSITIQVNGNFAYGWLRSEHGVHRLVRISPFDGEKLRHTTFALVEVVPIFATIDESKLEIPEDDLRLDTFLSSGKGGQSVNTTYSAVRLTHLPTGIAVSCQNERSQLQNKTTALRLLKGKLYTLMVNAQLNKLSDIKGEHKTAAWGNQIRSYVLHPYKLVKDHRTDYSTTDPLAVLDGALEPFMESYLKGKVI